MRTFRVLLVALLVLMCAMSPALGEEAEYSCIRQGDTDHIVGMLQDLLGVYEWQDMEPFFGEETLAALTQWQAERGLEESGVFDAATLKALLEPSGTDDTMVWIPMHTGKKYHDHADCSSMSDARQMPLSCAKAIGFAACKKCYRLT